jgi:hypothetical protein
MNKTQIEAKIKELEPWYQRFRIKGVWTTSRKSSGPGLWNQVKEMLPDTLTGLRIIDLGCNASIYSCEAAYLGASVVSIDNGKLCRRQASFVKEQFEDEHNKNLDITYVWENIANVDFELIGKVDYVFALAVIYHIGVDKFSPGTKELRSFQQQVISRIKTDKFIVRTRAAGGNSVAFYDKFFDELGFIRTKGKQKNARGLVLYERT